MNVKDYEAGPNIQSTLDKMKQQGKLQPLIRSEEDREALERLNEKMCEVRRKFIKKQVLSEIEASKTFVY